MQDRTSSYGPPVFSASDAFRRTAPQPTPAILEMPGAQLPPTSIANTRYTSTRNVSRSTVSPPPTVGLNPINQVPYVSNLTGTTPIPGQRSIVSTYTTTQINPAPGEVDTNFQRSLAVGGPIDPVSLREDRFVNNMNKTNQIALDQYKRENDLLRAEVHRLRKIEAGWNPGGSEEETRVTVINNYLNQIQQYSEEINVMKNNMVQLEAENANLREQIRIMEANPRFDKREEEYKVQMNRLISENATLKNSSANNSALTERTYSTQIDNLRKDKFELENELRTAQTRISQLQEKLTKISQEERMKVSSMVDSERMTTQKLKDEIARLQRDNTRLSTLPAPSGPDTRTVEQMKSMSEQINSLILERDRLSSQVVMLESKSSSGPFVERVFDESGVKDRDKVIQHYKQQWDELKGENMKIKNQLTVLQEENQRMKFKIDSEGNVPQAVLLSSKKDKELQEMLRQELEAAKEETNYYKNESNRLRDQIRVLSTQTNKTEIVREVIVDKSGQFSKNLINNSNMQLNLPPRYGDAEIISRSVTKNEQTPTQFTTQGITSPTNNYMTGLPQMPLFTQGYNNPPLPSQVKPLTSGQTQIGYGEDKIVVPSREIYGDARTAVFDRKYESTKAGNLPPFNPINDI